MIAKSRMHATLIISDDFNSINEEANYKTRNFSSKLFISFPQLQANQFEFSSLFLFYYPI